MPAHRAAAQVHKGVITVTGVPAAEGEVVEVIVIRGSRDADRYASAPVPLAEFSDIDEPLAWDGDTAMRLDSELHIRAQIRCAAVNFEQIVEELTQVGFIDETHPAVCRITRATYSSAVGDEFRSLFEFF